MFGALFRRACAIFGVRFSHRKYFSEVTKTIEMLPFRKKRRWLAGGILHFFFVAAVLLFLAMFRVPSSEESLDIFSTLIVAGIWAWVGPAFIWYYERYTLPILYRDCQRVITNVAERQRISKLIFRSVSDFQYSKVIIVAWIALALAGFLSSQEFLGKIGVGGAEDWVWWLFVLGVVALGYYTSIGLCLAQKGTFLANEIAKSHFEWDLYKEDRMYGLSFLGRFSLMTNLILYTGWLFVPLLFVIADEVSIWGRIVMWELMVFYLISILMAFFYPIFVLHKRIIEKKRDSSEQYLRIISNEVALILKTEKFDDVRRLEFYRQIQSDVLSIREWPLGVNGVIAFAASQLILPLVVAILAAAWTVDKVSP